MALVAVFAGCAAATHADNPKIGTPRFIPATAGWLESVNYFRSIAGLAPVTEDPSLEPGAMNHSCYMVSNDITHEEDPANPDYTSNGFEAGQHSNVATSSSVTVSDRSFVELWMTGPYHAIGILRPGLHTVGFARCDRTGTSSKWASGATLNVLDGLVFEPPSQPILFPGNGTTTNLNRYLVETPDALEPCGWTAPAGLPVLAMMPESTANASATITGPDGHPLETCVLTNANTTGIANQILGGDDVVVVIPREPLTDGRYDVHVHTDARDANWSFTIDQAAAKGPG